MQVVQEISTFELECTKPGMLEVPLHMGRLIHISVNELERPYKQVFPRSVVYMDMLCGMRAEITANGHFAVPHSGIMADISWLTSDRWFVDVQDQVKDAPPVFNVAQIRVGPLYVESRDFKVGQRYILMTKVVNLRLEDGKTYKFEPWMHTHAAKARAIML